VEEGGAIVTIFEERGFAIRKQSKDIVLDFMKSTFECSSINDGMKLAEIFRACGFDWGNYENATSSNQQYWLVALLRELEKENKVQRDPETKRWKLI
jgi:hypothetical protein